MAQTHIRALDPENVFGGPLDDTVVVSAGDLVYWDNITDNEFKIADADAGVVAHAEYIAMHGQVGDGTNTKRLHVLQRAEIYDEDAPFTANSLIYLADDLASNLITDACRNLTHTRPTTATDLIQVVGYAITTKRALIDLGNPKEISVPLIARGAVSAQVIMDSGNFGGPTVDASGEAALFTFIVPDNIASATVVAASLWVAADATVGTPTMDVTVGSAVSGAQHDAITADASLVDQVREGSAAHEILKIDASSAFNATDIIRPGAIIGVKCAQDDGGTDISWILGGEVIFRVTG